MCILCIPRSRIDDLSVGRVTSPCVEQLAKGNDMSSLYLWQIDCKYAISFLIKIPFWCGCKFCTGIRCSCTCQDAVQIATLQRSETRRQLENSVTREWHLQSILMGNLKKWSRVSGEQGRGVLRYRYNEKWEKWEWEVRTETLSAVEWKDHQAWTRLSCSGCQYRKN